MHLPCSSVHVQFVYSFMINVAKWKSHSLTPSLSLLFSPLPHLCLSLFPFPSSALSSALSKLTAKFTGVLYDGMLTYLSRKVWPYPWLEFLEVPGRPQGQGGGCLGTLDRPGQTVQHYCADHWQGQGWCHEWKQVITCWWIVNVASLARQFTLKNGVQQFEMYMFVVTTCSASHCPLQVSSCLFLVLYVLFLWEQKHFC